MAELTLSDGQRTLELIGTGPNGIWLKQDGLNLPVVGKELTYAESADSEGRRRIRSKPQNAEGSFSVFIGPSDNLITNASFEIDTTGWGATGAGVTLASSSTRASTGASSLYVTTDGTAVDRGFQSDAITITPGCVYTGSISVFGGAGVNYTLQVAEYEVDGTTLVGSTSVAYVGTGNWDRISATRTTTTGVRIRLRFTKDTITAGTFYADDAKLETVAGQGAYTSTVASALFWDAVDNLQGMVESAHENKGTITYTPPGGEQVTYDLQSIQVTGMPQSGVMLLNRIVEVEVSFECLPYGRLEARRLNLQSSYADSLVGTGRAILLPLCGSSPLTDLSGNSRNGTAVSFTPGTFTPGPLTVDDEGASDFGGTNDYITTTYNPFTNGTTRTFMGWAYRDSSATADTLFGGSVANPAVLALSAGSQNVTFKPQNATTTTWAAAWPGNTQWVHWALVFNESTDAVTLYINGALVSATTNVQAYNATPGNFQIGSYNTTTDPFDGKMAWVSVHTAALTAAQIGDAYDAGKAQATLVGPIDSFQVPDIPGQVPALGELTLTETSVQARNHIEVGVQHNYVAASAEPIQRDAMTQITALAGASSTRAGSLATNTILAGITTTPVAVCVADNEPHSGRWKIRARLWPSAVGTKVRLAWRAGSAPFVREKWITIPGEDAWFEVDLGTVNIPELTPTHTADFRIEARAASGIPTLDVDVMYFEPADNYTRLRGDTSQDVATAAVVAADDFNAQTSGALAGKTPVISTGNWSGAGDADDFGLAFVSAGPRQEATRQAVSDAATGVHTGRLELCGTGVVAACTVSLDLTMQSAASTRTRRMGVILRYVDINNFLVGYVEQQVIGGAWVAYAVLTKRVASVNTELSRVLVDASGVPSLLYSALSVSADASGNANVYVGLNGAEPTLRISVTDAVLATAAALDDGRVGMWDWNTDAIVETRLFNNFVAVSNAAGATVANPAMNSAQSVILAHNTALTENAAGTGQGKTPIREGQYLTLPPETRSGNSSRITVKARRVDVDSGFADSGTADTMTATLSVTPRVHLTSG
jgi:hypothetical protein